MYIPIQEIIFRHKANIKGILHLGAHLGEEAKEYHEAGVEKVIWIEGNPALIEGLKENVSQYMQNQVFNLLVSDMDKTEVSFNITEFSQSSSILDLGITKEIHGTNVIEKVPLTAYRLDNFFVKNKLESHEYNFVNIDLQGYELIALKSMGVLLDKMDWVYAEVNLKRLYKNCALLYQMDRFLLKHGFVRVQTYMTTHYWGDALYKKIEVSNLKKITAMASIYSEEAARSSNEFLKTGFSQTKRMAKKIIKNILVRK